jgi:hypothetical protein
MKKITRMAIVLSITWIVVAYPSIYLYEIKSTGLKTDFQYLSYLYNYIWYGEFEMPDHTFQHAKKAFETTLQSLQK